VREGAVVAWIGGFAYAPDCGGWTAGAGDVSSQDKTVYCMNNTV